MAAQSRRHLRHSLSCQPVKSLVLDHKNHENSIGKNKKRENIIECLIEFIFHTNFSSDNSAKKLTGPSLFLALDVGSNSGLRKCKKNNPTSIFLGAVPDNGVQAQLVLRSLKLLSWPPTLHNGVIVSHLSWGFFFAESKTIDSAKGNPVHSHIHFPRPFQNDVSDRESPRKCQFSNNSASL